MLYVYLIVGIPLAVLLPALLFFSSRNYWRRCTCPIHTGQYTLVELFGRQPRSEVWLAQAKRQPQPNYSQSKALKTEGSRTPKHARVQFQMTGHSGDDMCVIKIITIERMDDANQGMDEALRLAQLHHPHVVELRQQFLHSTRLFQPYQFCTVLELCTKGTVRDLLNESPTGFDLEKALNILQQVLSGLAALHELRIVHGDIKPDNIFLAEHRTFKIGDLGLAQRTARAKQAGCVAYMAPEIISGREEPTDKIDVWACGIVFLEMLYGFGSAVRKSMSDSSSPEFPSILAGFLHLGEAVAIQRICELNKLKRKQGLPTLLLHALSVDPKDRCSALELELEVQDLQRPDSPGRTPSSPSHL